MASRGSKNKRSMERRSHFSRLSDDLLVEIFSRVPFKSTCCCKCVSTRWRSVLSHPDHSKKLSQSTFAGFFYETYNENSKRVSHCYQSVSGKGCPRVDPSLSFIPRGQEGDLCLVDSCNGLLLCQRLKEKRPRSEILDYVVCNPATEKWVAVPTTEWSNKVLDARLGFDPAVSSHFHVFEFIHARVWDADMTDGQ
ncbi:hypothetical protein QYE76_057689 [Lolium multiflorum]|uniref:F-box domain-containing protein n=1 Tax=Lolium multiflorum TaxID=4521 RepID=A0AAD8T4X2_LOLMU|nr:hypothetical protein QYE76_057689 [Lolium multiflorum]